MFSPANSFNRSSPRTKGGVVSIGFMVRRLNNVFKFPRCRISGAAIAMKDLAAQPGAHGMETLTSKFSSSVALSTKAIIPRQVVGSGRPHVSTNSFRISIMKCGLLTGIENLSCPKLASVVRQCRSSPRLSRTSELHTAPGNGVINSFSSKSPVSIVGETTTSCLRSTA